jgi:hypothetical protein
MKREDDELRFRGRGADPVVGGRGTPTSTVRQRLLLNGPRMRVAAGAPLETLLLGATTGRGTCRLLAGTT